MAKSPGDFTGKQKARLQKEAQEKQAKESNRLSMITAEDNSAKSNEVIDYTNVKKTVKQPTGPGTQVDPEPVDLSEGGDQRGEVTTATSGDKAPEPVTDEVIDTARSRPQRDPIHLDPESVLVRARYDLPQVTIGHGNHYDFEAGRRYKIPYDAAIQLSERDLVDVLS
ncbi:MAG: hypothetical protein ABR616_10920 [Dermatophilaceae bacterium]|nr:hypothetical protein [Intrasporangiaceae bacterium]